MTNRARKVAPYKYKPEFCNMLLDHMSRGYSFESFGAVINVVRSTLYKWCDDFPEFGDAKDIAFAKAQYWYERRLVAKVSGDFDCEIDAKEIDTSSLIFALKTRFKDNYSERHEHAHDVTGDYERFLERLKNGEGQE